MSKYTNSYGIPTHKLGIRGSKTKRARRTHKHETRGADKSDTCKASRAKRWFAGYSRARKDPAYIDWCKAMDKENLK